MAGPRPVREPLPSELNTSGSLAFLEVRHPSRPAAWKLRPIAKCRCGRRRCLVRALAPPYFVVLPSRRHERRRCLCSAAPLSPQVGKDKLTVRYNGPAQHDNDVGSIQVWLDLAACSHLRRRRRLPWLPSCSPGPLAGCCLAPCRTGKRLTGQLFAAAPCATSRPPHSPRCVQANHPAPRKQLLYYFEVTVKEASGGSIAIGFADHSFKHGRHPGWGWQAAARGGGGGDGGLRIPRSCRAACLPPALAMPACFSAVAGTHCPRPPCLARPVTHSWSKRPPHRRRRCWCWVWLQF